MTWSEAVDTCKQNDGFIANTHPEVSLKLRNLLIKSTKQPYWIGKSLSPWVMLRGCVERKGSTDVTAVYTNSKYNQKSECAAACIGSTSFLLQRKSCYCLNKEENITVTIVPYKACTDICPGMSRDKCGGKDVFTFYEYYHGEITESNDMYNYICKKDASYIQCSDDYRGFTCELTNGSKVSYKEDVPRRDLSLTYIESVEYCSNLQGGLRMSPIPEFNVPYLGNPYWTTITRAIDWNYDTVSQRSPEFSCISMMNKFNQYEEEFRTASDKYGFVCQYDDVTLETYTDIDGNITSPEYKNNQLYKYNITLNNSTGVKLVFEDINLEESTGCVYDYIEVLANNGSLEKFCGKYEQKKILVRGKTVLIVFRSDSSISGTGFRMFWSEANDVILVNGAQRSSNERSLSGGTIVGITVAAAVVCVIVASFIACLIYRKTHQKQTNTNTEDSSNVHNLAYAMSSFNTGSSMKSDNYNTYLTVTPTNDKKMLQAGALCDPNKGKQTRHDEIKDDDNYLNAGLASNIRTHYDDIESPSQNNLHTQVDKTKKNVQMESNAENEYIEI
ncbi:uncharacterized protein LOC132757004 isoform X2 [Ruditapes philippinarum]|nr:uncharacterized protein LOC132757004 isoform X2 [Ruditapes philippinarum]